MCILLATHNGAPYLEEQLQSYLDQDHQNWSLWVSDDASVDNTRDILCAFQQAHPDRDIKVSEGPNKGLFANFMNLIRHPDLPSGYVALSDQDDVWLPHRLSRALGSLRPAKSTAFYCSTSIITDAKLRPISEHHPQPLLPASFENALVQNIVAGNTIMLNPKALALLRADPKVAHSLPFHDWWIYLRLMAAGAELICDPEPGLLYRQHENNALGHRRYGRVRRLRGILDGTYGSWVAAQTEALLRLPTDTVLPSHRRAASALLKNPKRLEALRQSRAERHGLGRLLLPALATMALI